MSRNKFANLYEAYDELSSNEDFYKTFASQIISDNTTVSQTVSGSLTPENIKKLKLSDLDINNISSSNNIPTFNDISNKNLQGTSPFVSKRFNSMKDVMDTLLLSPSTRDNENNNLHVTTIINHSDDYNLQLGLKHFVFHYRSVSF